MSLLQRTVLAVVALVLCSLNAASAQDRVVVVDPLREIYGPGDVEPAGETVLLVAPRNGRASACAVLPGVAAEAAVSELRSGETVIPAERVQVRYAGRREHVYTLEVNMDDRSKGFASEWSVRYTNNAYHDVLGPSPSDGADVHPVWVTVAVPADAAAGTYRGTLSVGGEDVPVELRVLDYVLPAPRDWAGHAGLDLSLEVPALQWGAEPWSEEHWRLIGETLDLLALTGTDDLHLPVFVLENHLATRLPVVVFRTVDGALVPDMTNVRRLMKLFGDKVGVPSNLVLDVWDPVMAGGRRRGEPEDMQVLVIGEDGNLQEATVPAPSPDSASLYHAMVEAVAAEVKAAGWPEGTLKLGYGSDRRPDRRIVEMFQDIAPGAGWALFTHGRGDSRPPAEGGWLLGTLPVGQFAHVYVTPLLGTQEGWPAGVRGGWTLKHNCVTYGRLWLYNYSPLGQFRGYPDGMMGALELPGRTEGYPAAGFVHVGFNFWSVPGGDGPAEMRGKRPQWANMFRTGVNTLTAPGPKGPLGTTRLEMFVEGQQENQARVDIEKALLAGNLPDDLAAECSAFLVRRNDVRSRGGQVFDKPETYIQMGYDACLYGYPSDWRETTARLYDLAGRVQRAAGR